MQSCSLLPSGKIFTLFTYWWLEFSVDNVLQLPDAFQDFASKHMRGKHPSSKFIAHCRRELLHAQWEIMLDDDFLEAYQHGIVFKCCDEITRRFYPRILTYSADYKEK